MRFVQRASRAKIAPAIRPRRTAMPTSTDTTAAATQPVEGALVGKRVQKYEIVRTIGRGGMGTVYEALNTAIGKRASR